MVFSTDTGYSTVGLFRLNDIFLCHIFPHMLTFLVYFQKELSVRHLRMGSKIADFLHTLLCYTGSTIQILSNYVKLPDIQSLSLVMISK